MTKYNIHNILKISSELPRMFPSEFVSDFESSPDLIIKIGKFWDNKNEFKEIFPGIYSSYEQKKLFASFSFLGKKIEYGMIFKDNSMELYLDKSYIFFSKYILKIPISSLFPLEHLIKLITQVQLLKKGYSFFISAGIEKNGEVLLISSPGGMGKSAATTRLISENEGLGFLGDDTLITDGLNVFSYPRDIRIRKKGTPFLSINQNIAPGKYFGKNYLKKEKGNPSRACAAGHRPGGRAGHGRDAHRLPDGRAGGSGQHLQGRPGLGAVPDERRRSDDRLAAGQAGRGGHREARRRCAG